MRTAAQVHPAARTVHRDRLVGGQFHHPFGLEALALLFEEGADLVAGPDLAHQGLVARDHAAHLVLDRGQVLVGERPVLRREIVIEAVVGRRAEGDLRAGEEVLHRLGEDMRKIVARQFERVGLVAVGDQGELGIALERPADVAHLAIDPRRDRRLGEARPDRRGDVGGGRARRHFAHGAIGKRYFEHFGHRVDASPWV